MRYDRELICASDDMIYEGLYQLLQRYRNDGENSPLSLILDDPSPLDEYSLFVMGLINIHTLNQNRLINKDFIGKMKCKDPIKLFEDGIQILREVGDPIESTNIEHYLYLKNQGILLGLKQEDYEFIETAGEYWYRSQNYGNAKEV